MGACDAKSPNRRFRPMRLMSISGMDRVLIFLYSAFVGNTRYAFPPYRRSCIDVSLYRGLGAGWVRREVCFFKHRGPNLHPPAANSAPAHSFRANRNVLQTIGVDRPRRVAESPQRPPDMKNARSPTHPDRPGAPRANRAPRRIPILKSAYARPDDKASLSHFPNAAVYSMAADVYIGGAHFRPFQFTRRIERG